MGCKWISNLKEEKDGGIERFKARFMAKGFTQTYRINYQETFTLVAKLNTVRLLLSIAVYHDWPLHQINLKNAFLNVISTTKCV